MATLVNLRVRVGSGISGELLFDTLCLLSEEGISWLGTLGRHSNNEGSTEARD